MKDHHGNNIPAPLHTRAELKALAALGRGLNVDFPRHK